MRALGRLLSPRLLRFGVVGFSGVFVNLGALWMLADRLGVPDVAASALAIEISIVWNFFLNDAWTFSDRNAQARAGYLVRMFRYNVVSLVGLLIQLGTFVAATSLVERLLALDSPGLWKYPAQLAGIAVAMGWNFVSNFYWTWAQRPDPLDGGPTDEHPSEDPRPAAHL